VAVLQPALNLVALGDGAPDALAVVGEGSMKRMTRVVTGLIVAALAWVAAPAGAQERPLSLVYAVYDNENGAMNAYKQLQEAQREQVVRIQAFAVVAKDANGKVHVQRSNQRRGTIAGVVIGGVIGSLAGPAGAAVGATAGGAMGHATGEAFGIPREDIKAIKETIPPGSSALVAVLDERWAGDLTRSLQQTESRRVLATKIEQGTAGQAAPSGTPSQPSGAPSPSQPSGAPSPSQPSGTETPPGTAPQP
jgi:uncharacterized membrane protein